MTFTEFLSLTIGLLSAAAMVSYTAWLFALRPWWYSLDNQRERLARRLAFKLADNVLHRAFDFSYITTTSSGDRVVKYVKFVKPLRDGVTMAADHPERYHTDNQHPDSYLTVWDWSTFGPEELPVAQVNLELDTTRLPYDTTLDDLLTHRRDIEEHAEAVLLNYGVVAVRLRHKLRYHRQHNVREITFQCIFRENEKGPAIPQHVDYDELLTAWQQQEDDQVKYTRQELLAREKLAARLLDHGITHYGATFPLKKLQADFDQEISHRQIERLGAALEQEGILEKVGGPFARRVNLAAAATYLERQRPPATNGGGP